VCFNLPKSTCLKENFMRVVLQLYAKPFQRAPVHPPPIDVPSPRCFHGSQNNRPQETTVSMWRNGETLASTLALSAATEYSWVLYQAFCPNFTESVVKTSISSPLIWLQCCSNSNKTPINYNDVYIHNSQLVPLELLEQKRGCTRTDSFHGVTNRSLT
jgi:hypothetical protein